MILANDPSVPPLSLPLNVIPLERLLSLSALVNDESYGFIIIFLLNVIVSSKIVLVIIIIL